MYISVWVILKLYSISWTHKNSNQLLIEQSVYIENIHCQTKLTVRPVINDVWVRIKKRVNATPRPVQLVNGHLGPSGLNVQLHADMEQLSVLANAPVIVKVQTLKCHFEIGY